MGCLLDNNSINHGEYPQGPRHLWDGSMEGVCMCVCVYMSEMPFKCDEKSGKVVRTFPDFEF